MHCPSNEGLGRDVPGCPAFIRISNWWSLMILCGWLISAHHLAIWALKFHKWLHSEYKWSTHLDSSVVWAQWDILMGGWPWWVSTANINSSHPPGCVFLSADLTRCWPKHLTAWLLRLDMAAQIVWLNIWHIFGMSQFISCDEIIIWSANSQKSVTCIYSQPNELFTTVVDRQIW